MNIQNLLSDFFRQDNIAKLVLDCGEILGCPLMVVDETFHVVAHYTPGGFEDKVFLGAISRGEITYEAIGVISGSDKIASGAPAFMQLDDSPFPRRFSKLESSGIMLGYLICVDTGARLEDVSLRDFADMEAILAKQLFFELNRKENVFETAEEILEYLLDGGFSSEAYFKIQAASTYLADFKPLAFALIDLKGYHSLYLGSNHLKQELMYSFYASHPFLYKGDLFLFLHEGYDINVFRALAKEFHLKAVISNPIGSLFELPRLYESVHEAMNILAEIPAQSEGLVFTVSQLSPLIMLNMLKERSDLINPQIRLLADYDQKKSAEYCETLYRYLISGNSLKETCQALFTHRNTVLYRIRKAKEDFNIPVEDPNAHTYLLFSLSLILYKEYGPGFFLS